MSARQLRTSLLLVLTVTLVSLLSGCVRSSSVSISQVFAGEQHTCALDDSGSAWCWGGNRFGQLGDGTTLSRTRPVRVQSDLVFKTLSLGWTHTCGIVGAGKVWCWGGNFVGKLGTGSSSPSLVPVEVVGLPGPASYLEATSDRTCAIVKEALWCWGDNTQNVFGIDGRSVALSPVLVVRGGVLAHGMSPGRGCTMVAKVLCVSTDVDAQHDGEGFSGQPIDGLPEEPLVQLVSAQSMACGRTANGAVYCWGGMTWRIEGDGTWEEGVWLPAAEVAGLAADHLTRTDAAFCGLHAGEVTCIGSLPGSGWVEVGGFGMPNFTVTSLGAPWVIPFPVEEVTSVGGGSSHICAVGGAGDVWCTGTNDSGQLGNGSTKRSLDPVRVAF